eukprot:TRINITY_DN2280_c1_g1_i7.p1 TRINITY_DN2280_c1_g1~~TRINITY_DN2280_c1_g1_i7.p1  ORF type:complete len:491 (+),score=202.48 TRINITY_DN2280_c1_g1_i7:679-2151(+)
MPQWHPLFKPDFVLELQLPRHEALYRLTGWRFDPQAPGTIYRRHQLQPKIKPPKPPTPDIDDADASDAEPADDADDDAAADDEFQPPPPDVLERFVYVPELDDEHVRNSLDAAAADLRAAAHAMYELLANKNLYAKISAVQESSGVASHALRLLESRPALPTPSRLELPASVSASSEVASVQAALQAESTAAERLYLTVSDGFALFCPVAWFESSKLLKGDPSLAVQYKAVVYLLSTEAALQAFTLDPERYLLLPPPPPSHLRLVVLGAARSGQSTHARLLASRLGLELVSVDQLLEQHVAARSDLGLQALEALQQGFSVPSTVYSSAVSHRLQEVCSMRGVPPQQHGAGRGWVLDAFPRTVQEVTKLLNDGHMPHHVILLRKPDEPSESPDDDDNQPAAAAADGARGDELNAFPFSTNFNTSINDIKKRFKRGPKPPAGGRKGAAADQPDDDEVGSVDELPPACTHSGSQPERNRLQSQCMEIPQPVQG